MTDEQVQTAVGAAIRSLAAEHPGLEFHSVHERSTAHRLAVHFERLFAEWNVDCEYDRDGQLQKSLIGIAGCDKHKATHEILPDIIVHHRQGEGRENNLLVVEIKKHATEDRCDRRKLELLTNSGGHYQYQLGLYINIGNSRFECTWYKNGARFQ